MWLKPANRRRLTDRGLQSVLAKTKYYQAVGAVVNAALARILQDVLALPDITEVESHKLNELCRILNALEGLFVEDPNHVRSLHLSFALY